MTVKDYSERLCVKLSPLKSIFCYCTIFHIITRPRMSKQEWKRKVDERKEGKGIERIRRSNGVSISVMTARFVHRAPRDRVDANNRETP